MCPECDILLGEMVWASYIVWASLKKESCIIFYFLFLDFLHIWLIIQRTAIKRLAYTAFSPIPSRQAVYCSCRICCEAINYKLCVKLLIIWNVLSWESYILLWSYDSCRFLGYEPKVILLTIYNALKLSIISNVMK